MLYVLIILLAAVLFMSYRAAKFKAPDFTNRTPEPVKIDCPGRIEHFQTLIRMATVSDSDYEKTDKALFKAYREKLRELYPTVCEKSEYSEHGNTAMLFKIKGESRENPTVLMSHYDVVPVVEERWAHPPFAAEIVEGEIWGRGTLDTKITMLGIMESMEDMLKQGFVPKNDIYLSFSGDEEVSGISAPRVVDYLEAQGVKPALVLDEGGAVADGVFPGLEKPVAVIGIGEKGMCSVRLTAEGKGGHSSTPPRHTSLGYLSQSIVNIENHPFKAEVTLPVEGLLKHVGPYLSFPLRLISANLGIFKGLVAKMSMKLGGELNAMMRTTTAATMAQGSKAHNVLPNESTAMINVRLLNNTTPRQALDRIQSLCAEGVTAAFETEIPASPYASTDSENWQKVAQAVGDTWTDAIVSPYLMIAGSDSRHFSKICRDVYKFSAWHVSTELRGTIHNDNERIPVSEVSKTVEFFHRLIARL